MSRHVIILVTLFALIEYTNPVFTQSKILTDASPQAGGFSASRLARLDSGMNDWVKKNWVNGAVALIARHGKIVFDKAYGYNDMDTKYLSIKMVSFESPPKQKPLLQWL